MNMLLYVVMSMSPSANELHGPSEPAGHPHPTGGPPAAMTASAKASSTSVHGLSRAASIAAGGAPASPHGAARMELYKTLPAAHAAENSRR
jgi:hypothetical protein